MESLRAARLAVLASLVLLVPVSVGASCDQPLTLILGFLGSQVDRGLYGFVDEEVGPIPRNAAIYRDHQIGDPADFGFLHPLVELEVDGLWRMEPPPPSDTRIQYGEQTAVTTSAIDTEPPTGVELVSVERFGCGFRLVLDGTPSDDQTPADRLTYVFYGGNREEAMTTTAPFALVPAPNVRRWDESDYVYLGSTTPWFTVSVVDLAGNQSKRSEPVPLTHEKNCSAQRLPDARSNLSWVLGLAAFFSFRVRRRRAGQFRR